MSREAAVGRVPRRLFEPIRIGSMELSNRLVMSPVTTTYATDAGLPSTRLIEFLTERARGGVGLITLEACTVDRRHREVPRSMHFSSDDVIPAHRELVRAIHDHAAVGGGGPVRVVPQLVHPGPDGLAPFLERIPSIGPSVIPSYLTGTPSRALERHEIAEVALLFGQAAKRIRECGYDGLELHAAHGYMLLGSFLSPIRNRRTDDYKGATLEGRTRAVLEVLDAIAKEAGRDFPVTLRISGYERTSGGRAIDDSAQIAQALAAAGVDCFHVSGGVIDRLTSQIVNGSAYPDALNAAAAAAVRRSVDVPVMTVGRIHTPELAEAVLQRLDADLIAMARPLLADPELPRKAYEGQSARIRRCISCQTCIDSMEGGSMACAVNGRSGREARLPLSRSHARKHVVVVGAGTGGLEAARIAAIRGHRVTLLERTHRLGGSLLFAATVHPENEALLEFLLGEVAALPIEVRTGELATPDSVATLRPDAVIVANGGRVVVPRIPGCERPNVLTGPLLRRMLGAENAASEAGSDPLSRQPTWQRAGAALLATRVQRWLTPERIRRASQWWMPIGASVAVVGADLAGVELAEFLAERGRRVVLLEGGDSIAPEVGLKRRTEHMDKLDRLGVSVNTRFEAKAISERGVHYRSAGGTEGTIAVETVVLSGEVEPDTALYQAIRIRIPETTAVGDCTGLGLIQKAIADATRAACAL